MIQTEVKDKLADEILFGQLAKGGKARVDAVDGELVATFPVETGSLWGGYDPSGRMLIYTDGEDVVRWQGLGQSGVLAEGYIHASW